MLWLLRCLREQIHLKFLWLLEFFIQSMLAPVSHGCAQCVTQRHCQGRQRAVSCAGHSRGREPEAPPGGEACIRQHVLPCGCDPLSGPVEDWEVVDRPPDSIEKMLPVVSLVCRTRRQGLPLARWGGFSDCLEDRYGWYRDAGPAHNVQRCLEEVEQPILTLKKPRGPEHSL